MRDEGGRKPFILPSGQPMLRKWDLLSQTLKKARRQEDKERGEIFVKRVSPSPCLLVFFYRQSVNASAV